MKLHVAGAAVLTMTIAGQAQNCAVTSVGRTPISDLGAGLYLGQFQGGLYPGGVNVIPAAHFAAGLAHAGAIQPRTPAGIPSPAGKYVLLSVGMSNTTQEFCSQGSAPPCDAWTFMGRAAGDSRVNHSTLVIANGAAGGQSAATWDSPTDTNYDRVRNQVLTPQGLSEAQVQAVWVKVANPGPAQSLPSAGADAYQLVTQTGNIVRSLKVRYPNVQIVFLSNRIYAGYATTALNPEPYAYESGFAVKWLVEAQINQMAGGGGGPIDPRAGDLNTNTVAPWIAWGPDLWADGLVPRSDGLVWLCTDLTADGTHPAQSGRSKVGSMLLDFFLASPHAAWFRAGNACYANCDETGGLTANDFQCFLNAFVASSSYADCDGLGGLTANDFQCFLDKFVAGCS